MNIILYFLILISLLILFWQVSNLISVFSGSPYIKSNHRIITESLKLVRLKKGEVFYDLGCGNGDSLIEAAKLGAKATGFEISPYYYIWARLRTRKYPNIHMVYCDIRKVDLKKADIIYVYLLPKLLRKMVPNFTKMKKGSGVISIGFPINSLRLIKKVTLNSHLVYFYKNYNI